MVLIPILTHFYNSYKYERYLASVKLKQIHPEIHTLKHSSSNVYTSDYQKEAQKQMDSLKKKSFSLSKPLIVRNPYGTNTTSLYFYADSKEDAYVICKIEAKGAATFSHRLKNSRKLTEKQEYLITGLVPGKRNKVTLTFYNQDDRAISKTWFYVSQKADSIIPNIKEVKNGTSKSKLSDGLFALLGHNTTENPNIYLYDNNGVSRGRIPLKRYRTDRILKIGTQIAYSYDDNEIALVNRLGKVTKTYTLSNRYVLHHDFRYDTSTGKILCLVNDKTKTTIEDMLLSLDLKTGKTELVLDFGTIFAQMKSLAYVPEKNHYGGSTLDWIHLNSFDFVSKDSLIFSSREQSSIIKLDHIYDHPTIDYIIHGGSAYGNTSFSKFLLKKEGTFCSQGGQHTITFETSDQLPKDQYYIYMFNNNYGASPTIPSFDWSMYPGIGNFKSGTSYYYKYLVDEKERSYKLVQSFALPYSSIVSSVQHYDGNIITNSGNSKIFQEYTKDGQLIRSYSYEAKSLCYRVFKYDFKNYWFDSDQ